MHLREALIEAATGNDWHNCSWNGRTGRFCQENGPSTCATSSGSRTSEVYFAGWCLNVSLPMLLNFWYTFGLDFGISRLNPSNSAVRVPECLHSAESHRHICASSSPTAFRVSATASPAPHPQYRLDRSTKQCTRLRLDTGAIFFSFSETVKCVNIMPCITRR